VIKINLAPPAEPAGLRSRLRRPGNGIVLGGLCLFLAAGLGSWWWGLASEAARLASQVEEDQRELDRLKSAIAEHDGYRRDKEELERRVRAVEGFAWNQTRPVYLMDTVAGLVPAEMYLTRLEERSRQVRLAGVAPSTATIADFMASLKASGKFTDVDLVESRQDLTRNPRAVTFEVRARFEI
jgi:Tfp pilus assembly protein PilN